jgi:hypothetical protein
MFRVQAIRPSWLRLSLVFALAVILWGAGPVQAAKVKVWHHHSPSHHDKAQCKQAVVTNEGALRLSRQVKPLATLDATHVWDIVEDRHGNLFVATGDEGKIYKVAPDGSVTTAFDSQESQVLCLALAPDGSIYAGTGPSGLIVRIAPDGNARVICDTPENYVWSLALDAAGKTLFAGTGPKGRIYQVTPQGKASIFYTTKQEHILRLATGPDGILYAGTDKNGLVYRIDSRGKGFVLYSAPQTEVRSLLVTDDGLYAGTSAPTRKRSGASSTSGSGGSSSVASGGSGAVPVSAQKAAPGPSVEESGSSSSASALSKDKEPEKSTPAAAPSAPASGENSLYRIAADGTVREIFREKTLVLSLLRQDGKLFVGTGMEGQLFEINEATRERSEVARLDHGQIHCMLRRRDNTIVLGTGDPGKLYVLQDRYAPQGTVVSEVLDAKIISKWGALRWRADTPAGTRVSVAVRSGNVAEPDDTWSNWSAEQTDPYAATADAPPARFLQYRVTLATENPSATPALRSLAVRYMTTNQAPEITTVETPDLDAVNLDNPKKLKFKWTAVDANEDDLSYSLYVRKEGWKDWVLLEENLDKKEYEWDTTTTPAGMYRLKVVASDRKDNPEDDALSAERVSAPFAVAHVPPTVTVRVVNLENGQAVIEATATDPLVRLTAASFSLNGKKWINVFPSDGLFDSKSEQFRFKTEALKPGTYVVVLRVRDAAGNVGSGDTVFSVQTRGVPREPVSDASRRRR